jgi:hypothetical protein
MNYLKKYLKYKIKYVNLKNKMYFGGTTSVHFYYLNFDIDNKKIILSDITYELDENITNIKEEDLMCKSELNRQIFQEENKMKIIKTELSEDSRRLFLKTLKNFYVAFNISLRIDDIIPIYEIDQKQNSRQKKIIYGNDTIFMAHDYSNICSYRTEKIIYFNLIYTVSSKRIYSNVQYIISNIENECYIPNDNILLSYHSPEITLSFLFELSKPVLSRDNNHYIGKESSIKYITTKRTYDVSSIYDILINDIQSKKEVKKHINDNKLKLLQSLFDLLIVNYNCNEFCVGDTSILKDECLKFCETLNKQNILTRQMIYKIFRNFEDSIIPIRIDGDLISVKDKNGNFQKLTGYKIEIDTGNESMTILSKNFINTFGIESATFCPADLHISGIGSDTPICNNIFLMTFMYNEKIYKIICSEAIGSSSTDVLFGVNSGINMFFRDGLCVGKYGTQYEKELENTTKLIVESIEIIYKFLDCPSRNPNEYYDRIITLLEGKEIEKICNIRNIPTIITNEQENDEIIMKYFKIPKLFTQFVNIMSSYFDLTKPENNDIRTVLMILNSKIT